MLTEVKNREKAPDFRAWLLLIILAIIWGSSYILIKRGLEVFTAAQVGSLRIAITSLTFVPIFISRYKEIDWSKFKYFCIVGFAGSLIPAFLFAFAQTKISSSLTGVLSSLTPIFTLLLGILFFRGPFIWSKIIGIIIGLAGTSFLILFSNKIGIEGNALFGLLVVLACVFYATSLNTVNAYLRDIDAVLTSTASFIIVGIPATIFLYSSGFLETMTTNDQAWSALGYISLLAFFGTFIGSILFFKLVIISNPVFASLVSYLIPVVALFWGFIDGELINWYHLTGMLLILAGVYITKK